MTRQVLSALVVTLVVAGAGPAVHAGLISYDANNISGTYTGAAILGAPGDLWTTDSSANGTTALNDTAGFPTPVSIVRSGFMGGATSGLRQDPPVPTGYSELYDCYFEKDRGTAYGTLTGLDSATTYDLVLYVHTWGTASTIRMSRYGDLFGDSSSKSVDGGASTLTEGRNYLRWEMISPNASGEIRWDHPTGNSNYSCLDGLQIMSPGGIEVVDTAGTWDITREENPALEILEVDKTAVDMGPFDMEIEVVGGMDLIEIDELVLNESGMAWGDYHFDLGTGLGPDFLPSGGGDELYFTVGSSSAFAAMLGAGGDSLSFFDGTIPPGGMADFQLGIHTPGDDPYTFTLRQTPSVIPEPSTLAIWTLGLLGLGWYGWRKRFRI